MPARVGFTGVRAIATGEDVKGLLIGRKIYDLQAIKPKAPLLHPQVSGYRGLLHPCYIGGSFGGKGDFMDVPVCYLLSLKSGRPVKMVMDYSVEFVAGNPRHAAIVRVKTGVKKDGRFLEFFGRFQPHCRVRSRPRIEHGGGNRSMLPNAGVSEVPA